MKGMKNLKKYERIEKLSFFDLKLISFQPNLLNQNHSNCHYAYL